MYQGGYAFASRGTEVVCSIHRRLRTCRVHPKRRWEGITTIICSCSCVLGYFVIGSWWAQVDTTQRTGARDIEQPWIHTFGVEFVVAGQHSDFLTPIEIF